MDHHERIGKSIQNYADAIFTEERINSKQILNPIRWIGIEILSIGLVVGIWIYYRLTDIWLMFVEPVVTYRFLDFTQFLISLSLGMVLAGLMLFMLVLRNFLHLKIINPTNQDIKVGDLVATQLLFTPVFNGVLVIMELVTRTEYYEIGLVWVPFVLMFVYFSWAAFMTKKSWDMHEIENSQLQKVKTISSITTFSFGVFLIILLLILPLLLDFTFEIAIPVIF